MKQRENKAAICAVCKNEIKKNEVATKIYGEKEEHGEECQSKLGGLLPPTEREEGELSLSKAEEIKILEKLKTHSSYFSECFGKDRINRMISNIKRDYPIDMGVCSLNSEKSAKIPLKQKTEKIRNYVSEKGLHNSFFSIDVGEEKVVLIGFITKYNENETDIPLSDFEVSHHSNSRFFLKYSSKELDVYLSGKLEEFPEDTFDRIFNHFFSGRQDAN